MRAPAWLTARPVAHRGLHDLARGVVENMPGAITAAIAGNFSIEVDLQLSADGEAMVHHDGDLDKVVRVVRLGGFVNSAPDYFDGPKVLNGASDLMVTAFGDKGRHARTTVGVSSLPSDAAVEVDGVFEVS